MPSGKRAVIKYVSCFNNAATAASVQLAIAGRTVWTRSVPGASSVDNTGMMAVANAGENVELILYAPGLRGLCCGYLLTDG